MEIFAGILGALLMLLVIIDVFETVVLPRRVAGRFRLTAVFYRVTWAPWSWIGARIANKKKRETYLSVYGPLSLLVLLALWAGVVIVSFALLRWSAQADMVAPGQHIPFGMEIYVSGITFVGLEEALPHNTAARVLTVWEALSGFALLALVIGYLPVLYQSFSRRESNITLLDARAGSPPSASELMRRYGRGVGRDSLPELLRDWEHWSAELLESHVSYPVLGFFRSQHDNQSWVASLTTVLDVSAMVMAGVDGVSEFQAELTFAMARHAVVDLAKVFNVPPCPTCGDRLAPGELQKITELLQKEGVMLKRTPETDKRLYDLRRMYEPYVDALSKRLLMELPPWIGARKHNWTTSKWEHSSSSASLH